jgi:hypothetical protein
MNDPVEFQWISRAGAGRAALLARTGQAYVGVILEIDFAAGPLRSLADVGIFIGIVEDIAQRRECRFIAEEAQFFHGTQPNLTVFVG